MQNNFCCTNFADKLLQYEICILISGLFAKQFLQDSFCCPNSVYKCLQYEFCRASSALYENDFCSTISAAQILEYEFYRTISALTAEQILQHTFWSNFEVDLCGNDPYCFLKPKTGVCEF